MKAKDIAAIIEEFAPLRLQESYDNAGFSVGDKEREVKGVLLCVDISQEVIDEAIALGADMVISHHPIIFTPIKRLTSSTYVEKCVEQAIKNDIILYAAHTNLDSTIGGMSWRLGEILGIKNMSVLSPESAKEGAGFGVVGKIPTPQPTIDYIKYIGKTLNCNTIRHSDITHPTCRRIAICTGAGGSLMESARAAEVDMYLTADLRYNDFMTPSGGFTVVDIGHFESEYCVIDILFDILSKKMINFALHKSQGARNPVNYMSI